MSDIKTPKVFRFLLSDLCIDESEIVKTSDDFYVVNKSISNILSSKGIFDCLDSSGERFACNRFFDDWYLYAVPDDTDYIYSLLKLREQEHDAEDDSPADGDTPGVTISFISFEIERLLDCLADPTDANRQKLNAEINRVVAHRGQRHHRALKKYFKNPQSQGSYLVADLYIGHIVSFAKNGCIDAPEHYKEIVQHNACTKSGKLARLPRFVAKLNQAAGHVVCDDERLYIANGEALTKYEAAAILATHTGNTSVYSFAAEVEYHARFLTPLAKVKIPFLGRSVYNSAIRADMTVGDTEFEGPAPFHRANSGIVRRQYALHSDAKYLTCLCDTSE